MAHHCFSEIRIRPRTVNRMHWFHTCSLQKKKDFLDRRREFFMIFDRRISIPREELIILLEKEAPRNEYDYRTLRALGPHAVQRRGVLALSDVTEDLQ